MNDRDIKGEALYNDNRIHDIAVYASTSGYIKQGNAKVVRARFSEFKRLISSGEFASIDDLENSVYERFGILGSDNESNITEEDMKHLRDMSEELAKRDAEKKKQEKNHE